VPSISDLKTTYSKTRLKEWPRYNWYNWYFLQHARRCKFIPLTWMLRVRRNYWIQLKTQLTQVIYSPNPLYVCFWIFNKKTSNRALSNQD